jgi:divalent metal cation (Fe/Co/Zn/Cd) transporter
MESTPVSAVKQGVRIEVVTIIWMLIEMIISVSAGLAAHSLLLTAFGVDSLIELVSGGILLRRLQMQISEGDLDRVKRAEQRAAWIVAVSLGLLCVYVLISSIHGLLAHSIPDSSPVGILVSAIAMLIMPYLAVTKRRISRIMNSDALAGDAVNSITCAYMAGTVLVGLLLNSLFGWWWSEYAAALVFLLWLVRETLETFEEARKGNLVE